VLLDATRKVKIADFGLARQDHMKVERGIGTPAYMPPEMLVEGDEETNPLAVDVYAMGVIMWQLWFREVPFEGKAVHKIMSMVTRGKRPPMDKGDDLPPTELAELINMCWVQEHENRLTIDQVFSTFDEDVKPIIEANFTHEETPESRLSSPLDSNQTTQLTF
jgi:serine/threonine protein kinase